MKLVAGLVLVLMVTGGLRLVSSVTRNLANSTTEQAVQGTQTKSRNFPIIASCQPGKEAHPDKPLNIIETYAFGKEAIKARDLLLKGDFATLEQNAQQARSTKEHLPGGRWKLHAIYDGLSNPLQESAISNNANVAYSKLLGQLEVWRKNNPNSQTAWIASAEAWTSWAWQARGSGFANSVGEDGRSQFMSRLKQAHAYLNEAAKLSPTCPHYYAASLTVGLGLEWDDQTVEKIFQAGLQHEQNYSPIYFQYLPHLTPNWGGDKEKLASLLNRLSQLCDAENYSLIFIETACFYVRSLSRDQYEQNSEAARLVPQVRASFYELEQRYGLSYTTANKVARFTYATGDY